MGQKKTKTQQVIYNQSVPDGHHKNDFCSLSLFNTLFLQTIERVNVRISFIDEIRTKNDSQRNSCKQIL